MRPLRLGLVPLIASACMAAPPTPSATIRIDPGATLASRSYVGGLCPDGLCSSSFTVRGDGSWEATSLPSAPAFTGTCPTAVDGVEVACAWTAPDGTAHSVSACDREIPADDPLVVALDAVEAAGVR